jgi:hypothetical protein
MTADQFWALIEPGKDDEEPRESLRFHLEALALGELESFQRHFDQFFEAAYRWRLWGAAYLIEGGCSDDGFIDFRYALISKGRAVYERALTDPDSLVEVDIVSDELFGCVAERVYQARTGQSLPRRNGTGPREPSGEPWDFEDPDQNRQRLPRIVEKFSA